MRSVASLLDNQASESPSPRATKVNEDLECIIENVQMGKAKVSPSKVKSGVNHRQSSFKKSQEVKPQEVNLAEPNIKDLVNIQAPPSPDVIFKPDRTLVRKPVSQLKVHDYI